jgi:DNA polymerase III psi subunit
MEREFLKQVFTEGIYVIPGEKETSKLVVAVNPSVENTAVAPAGLSREEMSLQQIAAMENNSAVEVTKPEPGNKSTEASSPKFDIEGQYKKKVLVLNDQLETTGREFLLKILGAVKLTIEDVAIIDCNKQAVNMQDFISQMHPAYLIGFGLAKYLPQAQQGVMYSSFVSGKTTTLLADSLAEIEKSKELKTRLWKQLQQVFA